MNPESKNPLTLERSETFNRFSSSSVLPLLKSSNSTGLLEDRIMSHKKNSVLYAKKNNLNMNMFNSKIRENHHNNDIIDKLSKPETPKQHKLAANAPMNTFLPNENSMRLSNTLTGNNSNSIPVKPRNPFNNQISKASSLNKMFGNTRQNDLMLRPSPHKGAYFQIKK